jgi:hypothetical protein
MREAVNPTPLPTSHDTLFTRLRKESEGVGMVDEAAVVSAVSDLLAGVYWLRRDGPIAAFNLAHSGRKRLQAVIPAGLRGEDRLRFLRLADAVAKATTGSCLRWNAEAIDSALTVFRRNSDSSNPGPTSPVANRTDEPAAPRRVEAAFNSFLVAQEACGPKVTDAEAYRWCQEHMPEGGRLPSLETWSRYVRDGRRLHGQKKHHSRLGRTGRSLVRPQDMDDEPDSV